MIITVHNQITKIRTLPTLPLLIFKAWNSSLSFIFLVSSPCFYSFPSSISSTFSLFSSAPNLQTQNHQHIPPQYSIR
jgi:hypothetical protein